MIDETQLEQRVWISTLSIFAATTLLTVVMSIPQMALMAFARGSGFTPQSVYSEFWQSYQWGLVAIISLALIAWPALGAVGPYQSLSRIPAKILALIGAAFVGVFLIVMNIVAFFPWTH